MSSRLSSLSADPRRPDLVMPWDREASKAEAEKAGKTDFTKEIIMLLATALAFAAFFMKLRWCGWASALCVCSYLSHAAAMADFRSLAQIATLAISGLGMVYAKPKMERRAVMKEIYALSQTLHDAGQLDSMPKDL
ncbi:hypothetical protein DUNSADRAFT_15206 [Dunaliella salina]|uniref:Uncharacterized protein n=1 Tax=Dunaliella salina TaxID=3046 RepID=A0ABQ7G5U4_DUNSA|nr:hypothetical protein DUNSADRAFT_15206 [Dunaliella salina]|eukprot:KAF5829986.1 hypothetical protein DUNSADRAFT_15206 [Dunaliella salina]